MANAPSAHPSPRVLLVEDDPGEGRLMGEILAELGDEPSLAVDSGQASERLDDDPNFLAALIDLHGVSPDGRELARQIRRREDASGTRIVAVTGASPLSLASEPNVFARVLLKPIDLDAPLKILATAPGDGPPLSLGRPGS